MSAAPAPVPEVSSVPAQDTPAVPTVPKIFAGNLAFAVTEEGLKEFFAVVAGDITSVQIIQHNHRSAGYGFVTVSNGGAVDKAIAELNGKELNGRTVNVAKAKDTDTKAEERADRKTKKRVGRRNGKAVPGEVTDAEANGETEKSVEAPAEGTTGEAETKPKKAKKARKPKKKTPAVETPADGAAPTATPAPTTTTATEATEGVAAPVKARKARTPRPPRVTDGELSKNIVFVANLTFNTDDAALTELFTSVGIEVVSARVIRKYAGHLKRSKGFGFVDVGGEEQQQKAIDLLNDKDIAGRKITVAKSFVHTDAPVEGGEVDSATAGVAALSVEDAARAASPETTVLAK